MIIILAALQLTSNDVHSRITRSKIVKPFWRPTNIDGSSTIPMETIQFADNQAVTSRSIGQKTTISSSILVENGSFAKPEGLWDRVRRQGSFLCIFITHLASKLSTCRLYTYYLTLVCLLLWRVWPLHIYFWELCVFMNVPYWEPI